jgi:hypothetical protein
VLLDGLLHARPLGAERKEGFYLIRPDGPASIPSLGLSQKFSS